MNRNSINNVLKRIKYAQSSRRVKRMNNSTNEALRILTLVLEEYKRLHLLNYPNKAKKRTHSVAFNRRIMLRKSNEPRAKRVQR